MYFRGPEQSTALQFQLELAGLGHPGDPVRHRSGVNHQLHKLHWILPEKVTFPEFDIRPTFGG